MSPRVKVRKVRRVVSLRRGWLTVYVCPVPMVVFRFARWFQ